MRARNIKPGFFKNEDLVECEPMARLLFIGLWCMADREGRLEDRPKRIKMEIFPGDNVDTLDLLHQLDSRGLIVRYEVDGQRYIEIPNFVKHQKIHVNEAASVIPGRNEVQPKEQTVAPMDTSTCHHGDKSCAPKEQALRSELLNTELLNADCLNTSCLNDESKTSCPVPCETHDSEPPAPRQDFDTGEEKPDRSHDDPVFIAIPTNKSGEEVPITESQVSEFAALYPAVDVPAELRKIRAWNISNPTHRKTRGGVLRHVNAWLSKAQNAPPGNAQSPTGAPRSGTVSRVTEKNLESLRIVREMEGRA